MSDYEKLKVICEEIDDLLSKRVTSDSPQFQAWHLKTERFLIRKFGENSLEHNNFLDCEFSLPIYSFDFTNDDYIQACSNGLRITKEIFTTYLEEFKDNSAENEEKCITRCGDFSKVFVVHGHNGEFREAVARLIEKQNIEAIILSEQANNGKTIIEKIEEYSDVGAAICLFTADDTGKANSSEDYRNRARQNVIFEAGYFMGKLSRKNVIILSEKNLELPSDMQGIVYIDSNSWQLTLLQNLKSIGFNIDFNKLFE